MNDGIAGQAYSCKLTASGGTAPYTWSIVDELYLLLKKWGLRINSSTGEISGTPRNAGTYNFTVKVTDSSGASATGNFKITISESEPEPVSEIQINATNFPDSVFRSYVSTNFDTDSNGYLSDSEIAGAKSIYVKGKGIKSLKGVEFFTSLTSLTCWKNDITELDLSKNTKLTYLDCDENRLTALDLSKNTALKSLYFTNNSNDNLVPVKQNDGTYKVDLMNYVPDFSRVSDIASDASGRYNSSGVITFNSMPSFVVYNYDTKSPLSSKQKMYVVITVNASTIPAPEITTSSLPQGTSGQQYEAEINVSGGKSPYTWTKSSGTLPTGLTLNKSTGKISGTPTTAGKFTFKVKVTDSNGKTDEANFTINIVSKPQISGTLSNGVIKQSYSKTLTASGGTSPYTWTKSSGTLPTGLTLNKSTGKISGKPTAAGTFTFKVKVTDKNGATATKSYTVKITKPEISGTLSAGTVGKSYSKILKAAGGTASYTWTKAGGTLPSGLKLGKTTGKISGTPTKAGKFTFKIKVTDKNGATATKSFTVTIKAASSSGKEIEQDDVISEDVISKSESEDENIITESEETEETLELNNVDVTLNVKENHEANSYYVTELQVMSDDVISQGTERDEDLVSVKANQPVRFIIGTWPREVSDERVYVDDELVEDIEVTEGMFTLPAEFVHDDFKVSVKAEAGNSEIESEELYISAE